VRVATHKSSGSIFDWILAEQPRGDQVEAEPESHRAPEVRMSDVFVVLLPFLFFFFWLVFLQRKAPAKIPRYKIILGFAVVVPLTICLLVLIFVLALHSPSGQMPPEALVVEPAAPLPRLPQLPR
jgi:hypothetical protein